MPYIRAEIPTEVKVVGPPSLAYTVVIIVRDSKTGMLVVGAHVTLNSYSGYTDISGSVTFENVPKGDYTLTVKKSGYHDYSEPITVDRDITKTVSIQPLEAGPGQSIVTVRVKLYGWIPLSGVKVTVNGMEDVSSPLGETKFLVEMNKTYTGEVSAWFIESKKFTFTATEPEYTVDVSVGLKWWIFAVAGVSAAALIYLAVKLAKPAR